MGMLSRLVTLRPANPKAPPLQVPVTEGTSGSPGFSSSVSVVVPISGELHYDAFCQGGDPHEYFSDLGCVGQMFSEIFARIGLAPDGTPLGCHFGNWNYTADINGPPQPPLCLIHGDKDTTVPIREAYAMQARAEAVGLESTLVKIDGAGHVPIQQLLGGPKLLGSVYLREMMEFVVKAMSLEKAECPKLMMKTEDPELPAAQPACDRYGVCLPLGAMGDGVNDDTKPMQTALDALQSGQTLRIPPGTYLVRNLTLPDVHGITITGASGAPSASVLKLANGSRFGHVLASSNYVNNQTYTAEPHTVTHLTFDGPADRDANGTSGLILQAWSSRVARCTFIGFAVGLRVTTVTVEGAPIVT